MKDKIDLNFDKRFSYSLLYILIKSVLILFIFELISGNGILFYEWSFIESLIWLFITGFLAVYIPIIIIVSVPLFYIFKCKNDNMVLLLLVLLTCIEQTLFFVLMSRAFQFDNNYLILSSVLNLVMLGMFYFFNKKRDSIFK